MRKLLLAGALIGASTLPAAQARAEDPQLSLDARRMLAYGTVAVMVGVCKAPVTPEQDAQIKTGMQKAAEAQHDVTQDQLTEAMKSVGARVGQNRETICANLTPDFIASSIKDAEAGDY